MKTLAIDIGGTKYSACVFDGDRMVARFGEPTDRRGGRDWMLERLARLGRQWREEIGYAQCGIGFGGPVLFDRQRVALSTHVGGWSDFPLTDWAREEFGVPCVMDNDANAGALGEESFGAGRGYAPVFYMTLSTGIGGGIVDRGRLWRGADSYGGEIGHIVIRPDGPECLCGGRGCLERLCCGLWIERDFGRRAEEMMLDPAFVERYVADLAQGLKAAVMLTNPARIVIGGGIAKAGERLFGPLRAELRRQVTSWSRARLDVVPAALGDDSVLFGARVLAREYA
jgi:glucokinase